MNDLEYLRIRRHTLDSVRRMMIEAVRIERDLDELDPDTPLFGTGLGLDSIDYLDLVVGIEATFERKVPPGPQGVLALRTINSIVDFVLEEPEP